MNRLTRKNYFDCHKCTQFRHRETLRKKLEDVQSFAGQIGLEISQVVLFKKN